MKWYNIKIGKLQLLKIPAKELLVGDVVTVSDLGEPTFCIVTRCYPGPFGVHSDLTWATSNGFKSFPPDKEMIVWRVATWGQMFWNWFYEKFPRN